MTTKCSIYDTKTNKKIGSFGYLMDGNQSFNQMIFSFNSRDDKFADKFRNHLQNFFDKKHLVLVSQTYGNTRGKKVKGKSHRFFKIFRKKTIQGKVKFIQMVNDGKSVGDEEK